MRRNKGYKIWCMYFCPPAPHVYHTHVNQGFNQRGTILCNVIPQRIVGKSFLLKEASKERGVLSCFLALWVFGRERAYSVKSLINFLFYWPWVSGLPFQFTVPPVPDFQCPGHFFTCTNFQKIIFMKPLYHLFIVC